MRKSLLALVGLAIMCILHMPVGIHAAGEVEINDVNFPDEVFQEYVKTFDTSEPKDNKLSESEISAVTKIDVNDKEIKDLTGIKHFTSLQELLCERNQLTNLDVSGMESIRYLSCTGNHIESGETFTYTLKTLDVSGCSALSELLCGANALTTLNVKDCTKLITLKCSSNQLGELDVKQNEKLERLECGGNSLNQLNVSMLKKLTILYCSNNPNLTSLNISECSALAQLQCHKTAISKLDISKCENLMYLNCSDMNLTTLDVSKNPMVYSLTCHGNPLTELVLNDVLKNAVTSGEKTEMSEQNREGYIFGTGSEYTFLSVPIGIFNQSYSITLSDEMVGGNIVIDKTTAKAGDVVNVTAIAEKGYALHEIAIFDEKGTVYGNIYDENGSFVMPDCDVIVNAVFHETDTGMDQKENSSNETGGTSDQKDYDQNSPDSGDESNVFGIIFLMMTSVIGILGALFLQKKRA